MRFPNAYKGVTKLFAAQVIDVAVSALALSFVIILIALSRTAPLTQAIIGGLGLVGLLLLRVCIFVLRLIGLIEARKDDKGFFYAFCVSCGALLLFLIQFMVRFVNERVGGWLNILVTLCFLISVELILISLHNLGKELNNPPVVFASSRLQLLMVIFYTVILLIDVYDNIPNMAEQATSVIRSILEFLASLMLMIYYGKARKMLSKPDDPDQEGENPGQTKGNAGADPADAG